MSNLAINDLPLSEELDRAAATAILGGVYRSGFGFIDPYTNSQPFSLGAPSNYSTTNITNNNFIGGDYNVIQQNPLIFDIDNGAGNSGTIINSFETTALTSASPVLVF